MASITTRSLSGVPQWVAYRIDPNPRDIAASPIKFPFDPNRAFNTRNGFDPKAKSNDPATWATRPEAAAKAEQLKHPERPRGVGIILGKLQDGSGRHIGGLDLDGCLDPKTEEIAPWAKEIMARFDSYAEISPSGKGLKIFFTYDGKHLGWLREKKHVKTSGRNFSRGGHVEVSIWVANKFFTVTEDWLIDSPTAIQHVDLESMLWLIEEAGPRFKGKAIDRSGSLSGASTRARKPQERESRPEGVDRSSVLFRIALDCVCDGQGQSEFRDLARQDPDAAGHLSGSGDPERALQRAWDNAVDREAEQTAQMERAFEDLPDSDPIAEFNRRFAFVRMNGKFRILDETNGLPVLLEESTFHKQELARTMQVHKRSVQVSQEWMKHSSRREFRGGVGFYPAGAPPGVYNRWKGWTAEPESEVDALLASCDLFLAHVREIICDGDLDAYDYAVRWMAHLVQRPEVKPGVAIVLRGDEGIGKDTFGEYLGLLCKPHYRTLTRPEDLTGRFNGLLDDALILHFQEIAWAGDPDARNRLYTLVSSPEMTIEGKGLDSVQRPSVSRIIISSNAGWVVPASPDARRFAVFDVSDRKAQDPTWSYCLTRECS